jgi:hypothetical protein
MEDDPASTDNLVSPLIKDGYVFADLEEPGHRLFGEERLYQNRSNAQG